MIQNVTAGVSHIGISPAMAGFEDFVEMIL